MAGTKAARCVKVTRFVCQTHTHAQSSLSRLQLISRTVSVQKATDFYFIYLSSCTLLVYVLRLTSSPVTDSTLRLFFILIGSFWAPGRSVPEPRQQSRWRARTGEVKGHGEGQTGVRPGQNRPPSVLTRPANSVAFVHASLLSRTKPGVLLP